MDSQHFANPETRYPSGRTAQDRAVGTPVFAILNTLRIPLLLNTVLLCAQLLIPNALLAQRFTFRQYAFADGLTDTTIHCLIQDHTGFLWVGTDNGLFRYDGTNFLAFHSEDGLPDAIVRSIAESPSGQIWVATRVGIARLNGHQFEQVDVGQPGVFRTIAFDAQGRVYAVSRNGLLRGTPSSIQDSSAKYRFQTITTGMITGFSVIGDKVWFGRDNDLWQLVEDVPVRVGNASGLPADRWTSVQSDNRGNLWVLSVARLYEIPAALNSPTQNSPTLTSESGHLSSHRTRTTLSGPSRAIDRTNLIPHASLSQLDRDGQGRIYVSSAVGVSVLDQDLQTGQIRASLIDARHGLPADGVKCVVLDREGSLWIGAEGSGLIRQLGQGNWLSWKKEDGLLHNTIWSVHRDRLGHEWVGSTAGLNLLDADGKVIRSWTSRDGLPGNEVFSIATGNSNDIYVSTYPTGIARLSEKGNLLQNWHSPSVLATGWILAMTLDSEGRLWTVGGAGCFRSRLPLGTGEPSFDRIQIPGTQPSTSYYHVVAYRNSIWISTSHGLARFANNNWRLFTKKDGLRSDDVTLSVPASNQVWVGYEDALGLTRLTLNPENNRAIDAITYTKADGLASSKVFSLGIDHSGKLWVATDAGVSVSEQPVADLAAPNTKSAHLRWHLYDTENGLIWNDTDGLALDSGTVAIPGTPTNPKPWDSYVWIGTSSGLSRFSPSAYPPPELPPTVLINSIEAAQRPWEPTDKPALDFAHRSLSLGFAALSYTAEGRTRFRYRLLGYEDRWTETKEKGVRFEGLPAGDYIFQLIAAGPDDLWSTAPAQFAFSIKPPWWQTWWFIAAAIALAILLVSALWRLRVRVLLAQKNRLERLVAERTAELTRSHRQLEEIAYSDTLTKLPNRRQFNQKFRERIDLAQARRERFALLLVDLDRFKQINDTLGHDAGDRVLSETANRLRTAVRDSDCVARLGGDEFAIILPETKEEAAVGRICERIVNDVSLAISFEGTPIRISASVGVALFPDDGNSPKSLYKSADIALYDAKQTRSNYRFRQHSQLNAS